MTRILGPKRKIRKVRVRNERASPLSPCWRKQFRLWLANCYFAHFDHRSSGFPRLVHNLQKYWTKRMGKRLPFGPSFKLPNLLVKRLYFYNRVNDQTFKRLIRFAHVPLDSYTLQALAKCGSELEIQSTAAMSFIKDRKTYERIQARIRKLAKKAKVPPITLDCLAWDEGHQ
jgi:hypothetical protein